jgi:hypothetical protein
MFRRAFSFDDAVHLGWLRDEPSESWTAGLGGPGEAELFASPKEKQRALAALERWVVREVVREQLSPWLSGAVEFGSDASSLEAMALRKLCECPLLSGSDAKVGEEGRGSGGRPDDAGSCKTRWRTCSGWFPAPTRCCRRSRNAASRPC